MRWSTPIIAYRWFGTVRLPSAAQGRWHEPGSEYAYIELTVDDVEYNVGIAPIGRNRSGTEVSDAG